MRFLPSSFCTSQILVVLSSEKVAKIVLSGRTLILENEWNSISEDSYIARLEDDKYTSARTNFKYLMVVCITVDCENSNTC